MSVRFETDGPIAVITIDRAEVRYASGDWRRARTLSA